eukprot:PhF_6_TR1017/c0_g1_i1/m.2040
MLRRSRLGRNVVGLAWLNSKQSSKPFSDPASSPSSDNNNDDSTSNKSITPASSIRSIDRVSYDVVAQEELLKAVVNQQKEDYKGIDVRDPTSVTQFDGWKPASLSMGDKVRAVSDFISGHIAHHVMAPDWSKLFDLKSLEMDVVYFLWVIHLHIVSRRAASVGIDDWAHRREVLQEMLHSMQSSWDQTAESLMGRPPLSRIREFVNDMYHVVAIGLEEALSHEGPGGDLALLSVLMRLIPLPRPEDLPMYTYYTIVHYIRFHIALLDRVADEEIFKGNFHFVSPLDPIIAKPYDAVALDEVIRGWTVQMSEDNEAKKEKGETAEPEKKE